MSLNTTASSLIQLRSIVRSIAPPYPAFAENWVKRTPKGFLLTIKLWQKFTHPKMFQEATGEHADISRADVDLFVNSIKPIHDSGKLGALLAQFPPSFRNDAYGQQILNAVIRTFKNYPLALELRHRSWSDDMKTGKLLTENNVCWVRIDEPKFKSSVAAETPLTSDIAYFRFHGRNAEMWWSGDNETRYKYLYSPEEIEELGNKVKSAEKARLAFAFFNNHWQGYAPRNAVDLQKALQLPFRDIPGMAENAIEGSNG